MKREQERARSVRKGGEETKRERRSGPGTHSRRRVRMPVPAARSRTLSSSRGFAAAFLKMWLIAASGSVEGGRRMGAR